MISARVSPLGIDRIHNRMIANRRDRSSHGIRLQLFSIDSPCTFRWGFADELDLDVENLASFDDDVFEWSFDLGRHCENLRWSEI